MSPFPSRRDRKLQRALIQAKRTDLIGGGEGLIPAQPPQEALEALRGDHDHAVANPAKGEPVGESGAEPPKTVYRPGQTTQQRRQGKKRGK